MSHSFQTQVAQLARVEDRWVDSAPYLAVLSSAADGRGVERGPLYVLLEIGGDEQGRDAFGKPLVRAISQTYFGSLGTIPMSLRRAVESANQAQYERNAQLVADRRRHVGVTLAAVVDGTLYIAEAGPALIYVLRGNELLQYPADSPWLLGCEFPADDRGSWFPLGVRRVIQVDLFQTQVGEGTVIALTSPVVAEFVRPDTLKPLLSRDVAAASSDLARMAEWRSVSAVVVRLGKIITTRVARTSPQAPAAGAKSKEPRDADVRPSVDTLLLRERAEQVLITAHETGRELLDRLLPDGSHPRLGGRSEGLARRQTGSPDVWKTAVRYFPYVFLLGVILLILSTRRAPASSTAEAGVLLSQAQESRRVALEDTTNRETAARLLRDANAKVNRVLTLEPANAAAQQLQRDLAYQAKAVAVQPVGYTAGQSTALGSGLVSGVVTFTVQGDGPFPAYASPQILDYLTQTELRLHRVGSKYIFLIGDTVPDLESDSAADSPGASSAQARPAPRVTPTITATAPLTNTHNRLRSLGTIPFEEVSLAPLPPFDYRVVQDIKDGYVYVIFTPDGTYAKFQVSTSELPYDREKAGRVILKWIVQPNKLRSFQ